MGNETRKDPRKIANLTSQNLRIETLDAKAGRYRITFFSASFSPDIFFDPDVPGSPDRLIYETSVEASVLDYPPTIHNVAMDFLVRGYETAPGEPPRDPTVEGLLKILPPQQANGPYRGELPDRVRAIAVQKGLPASLTSNNFVVRVKNAVQDRIRAETGGGAETLTAERCAEIIDEETGKILDSHRG